MKYSEPFAWSTIWIWQFWLQYRSTKYILLLLFVAHWFLSADKLSFHSKPRSWFFLQTVPQFPPSHLQNYSTRDSVRFSLTLPWTQEKDPKPPGFATRVYPSWTTEPALICNLVGSCHLPRILKVFIFQRLPRRTVLTATSTFKSGRLRRSESSSNFVPTKPPSCATTSCEKRFEIFLQVIQF